MQKCSCHSDRLYSECCEPFHKGALPKTAVELMRSRYSAYAKGLSNYIIKTTHKNCASYLPDRKTWIQQIQAFCKSTKFIGLEILAFEEASPKAAMVAFVATLEQQGLLVELVEKSLFTKEGPCWLYLNGTIYPSKAALVDTLQTY